MNDFTQSLQLPEINQFFSPDVWRVAITLAIVASLETLLCLEAVEQLDSEKRAACPNRELAAQGVGNVVAGFLGGLPITSVIVRSSANVHAGAKSRLSAVIHGLLLLLSVFLLTSIINLIPLACLALILLHTGYKLASPALFSAVAKQGYERFLPFIVTIVGIVATDLLIGIAIGLACSFIFAVRIHFQKALVLASYDDHYLLVFRKDVSFLGKVALKRYLGEIPDGSTLIIDATRADYIDIEIHEILKAFIKKMSSQINIELRNFDLKGSHAGREGRWEAQRSLAEAPS